MPKPMNRRDFARRAAALSVAPGMLSAFATSDFAIAQQKFVPNYDESKIPAYTLPDPLVMADGTRVTDADTWTQKRRPELLALFSDHVYGRTPTGPVDSTVHTHEANSPALDGIARRTQYTIEFAKGDYRQNVHVLIYAPAKTDGPVPAFLTLNFKGNHTIWPDEAIAIHDGEKNPRGTRESRWPVDTIVKRGYALVTVHYFDIDPDVHDGFKNGVHPLLDRFEGDRPDNAWGSIGGWAWGASRVLDSLAAIESIDEKRVAMFGHSRLGKTSLWAGAQDERFAITISNDSGCGGAALNRRAIGETVERITTSFPHWFCGRYNTYSRNENALPVDQHELIALCAPRPVYVASAEEDSWADPRGEFLSAKHAGPVYELFGKIGVGVDDMPPVNTPVGKSVGYHIRTGKHDVTDYDWARYLDFADRHLRGA